jgi:hypothetical protein
MYRVTKARAHLKSPIISPAAFASGYGLALLLVFVGSTILIGTSLSLILGPSVASYLGTSSIDTTVAKQVAQIGIDAAQSEMLSQMASGSTITTSYLFPSSGTTSVSMPAYPNSLAQTTVGSYYVTVAKARGFTYVLTANVTVNNQTTTFSKLVQLNASFSLTGATAIYSLRKLVSGYSGSAVTVRCVSGPSPSTQNIGFTSNGDFDVTSLKNCLGDSALPLDSSVDSSAKLAYGLRKLRSAYNGYAVKVQRDSDNTYKDIGFDSNGNLDIVTMQNWVGTATGYVSVWYDQSVNSYDLAPVGTGVAQPVIIYQGTLQLANNAPTLIFDSGAYLISSSLTGFINSVNITSFIVSRVDQGSSGSGRTAVLHKTGDASEYNTSNSMQLLAQVYNSNTNVNAYTNTAGGTASTGTVPNILFQATTVKESGQTNPGLYINNGNIIGTPVDSGNASANSITPDYLVVGAGRSGSTVNNNFKGSVSELILYASSVATAKRQIIERNEVHYYGISPMQDGFITTWYDQSGLGLNLTQATSGQQPYVDITGLRPAIYFDGVDDYLSNATPNITTNTITAFAIAKVGRPNSAPANGRILSIGKTGDGNDYGYTTSSQVIGKGNNTITNSRSTDLSPSTAIDMAKDFQATALFDGTTRSIRDTQNGAVSSASGASSGNFVINNIRLGWQFNGGGTNDYWQGRINEVILYPIAQPTTTYQNFETNEINYYKVR